MRISVKNYIGIGHTKIKNNLYLIIIISRLIDPLTFLFFALNRSTGQSDRYFAKRIFLLDLYLRAEFIYKYFDS